MILTIRPSLPAHRLAFSLVEMLVVIALIGILAAVSMALLGGSQREAVEQVRDQRNAQEVVSLTTAAQAAGAQVVEEGNMRGTIENLIEGATPKSGNFAGRTFRLSPLKEKEITGALKYLEWEGTQPVYLSDKE